MEKFKGYLDVVEAYVSQYSTLIDIALIVILIVDIAL